MTERQIESVIEEYCAFAGTVDKDKICEGIIPYQNERDFNSDSIEVVDNCYRDALRFVSKGELPGYSEVSGAIFDDYTNRQYAVCSIDIAESYDCAHLTESEFNELLSEMVTCNLDSDSYGSFLNYDQLVCDYFEEIDCPIGAITLADRCGQDINDFFGYAKRMRNPGEVMNKVEMLYENGIIDDIVVGDCQTILIPELVEDNCFMNTYNELCVVPDNKLAIMEAC